MKSLILYTLLFISQSVFSSTEFITEWYVEDNGSITIGVDNSQFAYYYTVDWGDGSIQSNKQNSAYHTYTKSGYYEVKISGVFPAINMKNSSTPEKLREVKSWGDISWKSMHEAFYGCENMRISTYAKDPDLSQVIDMSSMFFGCKKINGGIENWDVSNISNMREMFNGCSIFNDDLSSWDVSKVTNMRAMFSGCSKFNNSLDNWNVSSVTNMYFMFSGCSKFNQSLNNWNVSNVENFSYMFFECSDYNQPLDNWSFLKQNIYANLLFAHCVNFNQDISNWDVSKITYMSGMFLGCTSFNKPLNDWDVSNVLSVTEMFKGCSKFNQDISNWDVSNTKEMDYLFKDALLFNQDLSKWSLHQYVSLDEAFNNTSLSTSNYDKLLLRLSQTITSNYGAKLGASSSKYCNVSVRHILTNNLNWKIEDDGIEDYNICQDLVLNNEIINKKELFHIENNKIVLLSEELEIKIFNSLGMEVVNENLKGLFFVKIINSNNIATIEKVFIQ